ncbi:MAG TPA: hypothetical protein DDZ88_05515 [Verrucomicrobiales bacterium]|nr:hypothetical protein [Verrucomicrobiales bacterium]
MTNVSRGTEVFAQRLGAVEIGGFSYSVIDVKHALEKRVVPALRDDQGMSVVEQMLGSLATTQFATDQLRAALTESREFPDWQVGEVLAEVYLEDHHSCDFPWPMSRDARNPRGSLPGTDSVGFQKHGKSYRMAFGETKTSSDAKSPPGVWNGRSGLKKQLEGLRDSPETKNHIVVRYLGCRANGAPWQERYKAAASRYLANPSDVALFGVLVRDTKPSENDVLARAKNLAKGCPTATAISIVVIYLPDKHITKLPGQVADIERRNTK